MKSLSFLAGLLAVAAMLTGCNSQTNADPNSQEQANVAKPAPEPQETADAGKTGTTGNPGITNKEGTTGKVGMRAVDRAAQSEKYLFVLFRRAEDEQTVAMRSVLAEVMSEVADRADSVEVDATSASEKAIVDKFEVDRAPMPLLLAIAPNGAVTGGFPGSVDKQALLDSFVTPRMTECMKSLQENKLVLLCVQNDATQSNEAAMEGVNQFKADERFAQFTEILMLDPSDASESAFLEDLEIDPKTEQAVTVFLTPPGMPLAKYEGATNMDEIVLTLQKASSACGPGECAPGECGPGS